MPDLTILHTNDLHNRLSPASAEVLSTRKKECDGLLLDCGDAVWAGNVYFRPGGEPVLGLMSECGYDAMTLGNREFHFTSLGLKSKISRASYPVLCANMRGQRGVEPPTATCARFVRSGISIWVVGLTVSMVTDRTRTAPFSQFVFDDALETAESLVPDMRPRCDLLIALTHIGLKRDIELSRRCPDIDLIIGGHSHDILQEPLRDGGCAIVQTGSHGRYYGETTLSRTEGAWQVSSKLVSLSKAPC